jgi:hypothetical protein
MKETKDTIMIFAHGNDRYDVPKSKIIEVGHNFILGLDWIGLVPLVCIQSNLIEREHSLL